jgi:hypothetical protein
MCTKKDMLGRAVLLLVWLACALGAAYAQLLGSLEPVLHVQTDFFDIYAPQSLESQAVRLSGFADQTYAMLCEFFGMKAPDKHIPVLLSDIQYSLNGYTTLYPSNRIVILLASADPRSQLATMQDELSSVFLHELVHYVTLNERDPGWRAASWLLGDWVAPEVWMMPQTMVEGTAVWAESRLGEKELLSGAATKEKAQGASDTGAGPSRVGRLNDPAALEVVRLERASGQARSLWEVSGLADFYGAGSLPYLYGGLFVDFLSERFGPGILARLWHGAAGGNLSRGFDGTLTSKGLLEQETGTASPQLWQEFLAWVDEESALSELHGDGTEGAQELVSGYVGAVGSGDGALYFVDLEQRGLYALSLKPALRPERLLAVDGTLRNIFFNGRFGALELDWIRIDAQNRQIPARYRYDIKSHSLTYEYDLPVPLPGNALVSLQHEPRNDIFLYDPWEDPETAIKYGLARVGTAVLPARQLPQGRLEVAGIPDSAIRWLSPGFRDRTESADSVRFALSTVPENGLSRLAVLEEKDGTWQLSVARQAPSGGLHQPIFTDACHIVYRKAKKDGRTALCLLDIAGQLSTPVPIAWLSPTEWIARYAPESSAAEDETQSVPAQNTRNTTLRLRPSMFPELFSTSRVPYADGSRVGLDFIACDLTERLAWTAFAGWDFATQRPALSAEVQLAAGAWRFRVNAADQGVAASSVARRTSGGAMLTWARSLLPSFRSLSVNLHAAFAGVQNNYAAGGFFNLAPDYSAWATGLGLDFSSAYDSRTPPYDTLGFSLSGAIDYESASVAGFGGISLSASASLKGRLRASVYGAVAPAGGVAFAPAARYLVSKGISMLSAADVPYPEYREYRSFLTPSAWYVFGEAQYRLFSLEAEWGWILRLPFMPSFALRRIVGNLGLRGAGLDIGGRPSLLSSAFAAVDFDCAVLAGLAAEAHAHFTVEAAWAFQADMANVAPLCISIGLRTSL